MAKERIFIGELTHTQYDTVLTALKMELKATGDDRSKELLKDAEKAMYQFKVKN